MHKKLIKILRQNVIIAIITLALTINVIPVSANGYHPNLGDLVWHDMDQDGIQDPGEPGVPGVTVKLFFCNGNPVGELITDANGEYFFEHLEMAQYYVEFILPDGWAFSPKNQGGDIEKDSDADPSTGRTICTELTHYETDRTWDAGLYIPCDPASLGDTIWLDSNQNGLQDPGETGIEGVTVNLLNSTDHIIASTTTITNGFYHFSNLEEGQYRIEVIPPNGYTITSQDIGTDDTIDSDINPADGKSAFTQLDCGEDDLTIDGGLYIPCPPASIGDYIWHDVNQDGIQDTEESGMQGVTIQLLNSTDDIIASTVSDQNGHYQFNQLEPGLYSIQVILPNGYLFTSQDQGIDDAIDSDVDPQTGQTIQTTLDCGENDPTWDAGIYLPCDPAEIGDFVWMDLNINGIQDDGEPGIESVAVQLLNSTLDILASTSTDANGNYFFSSLPPGEYIIKFILPANHAFTLLNQGSDYTKDSDANRTTGLTESIILACGETNHTIDAGLYQVGDYGGCTHGFWKNHEENWVDYEPTDTLGSIFTFPTELASLESATLMEALNFNGGDDLIGAAQILFIQAPAALLNAANDEVNYPLTEAQIITGVNDALASLNRTIIIDYKDILDDYNNLGCTCCEDNGQSTGRGSRSSGVSSPPESEPEDEPIIEEPETGQPPKEDKPKNENKPPKQQTSQESAETTPLPTVPITQEKVMPLPPGLEIIALLGLILVVKKRRLLR